ncbi:MAG: hypothetical protein V1726_01725 [Methanobacteriota archaeon]
MKRKRLISEQLRQKIRGEVLSGKSRSQVAKDQGIGLATVYRYTKDIPGIRRYKFLDKEIIDEIRQEVITGKSKYQIAKELGLRFGIVYYHTLDLPNHVYREEGITGRVLELLKELLQNGYVFSTEENTRRLRRLKRYLPMIQRAQINARSVYYLSDKNKVALQSMIQRKPSKIIGYHELAEMSKVFGVQFKNTEKRGLLSRNDSKNIIEK